MFVSVLVAGDTEAIKTCFISIGHVLVKSIRQMSRVCLRITKEGRVNSIALGEKTVEAGKAPQRRRVGAKHVAFWIY